MHLYGALSPAAAYGVLVLFCLFLGLYLALFGLLVGLARRATGSLAWTLAATPFLWIAVELACARVTSFPWDQLGYSQIDKLLLTRIAPWTGNYGISFVIVAVNCAIAAFFLLRRWRTRIVCAVVGLAVAAALQSGVARSVPTQPTVASAVLLQPNLNVGSDNNWTALVYAQKIHQFAALSENECGAYFDGLPVTGVARVQPECKGSTRPKKIDLIVWPESPAPFMEEDPRFRHWVSALAEDARAPVIAGDIAVIQAPGDRQNEIFNSASFVAPNGMFVGRYDKMHLVPFGEYVPFRKLLSFAGGLTKQVGEMTHGKHRVVFEQNGHRFGVFICYEAIFADEVRQFARMGADVLVNISDDGWYGDTSAPWQHLNIARMRAIENDRWLLRDTNNGITAAIDPYGRVVQSLPRHAQSSLFAHFNYISRETFYTRHGDVFAFICAIIAVVFTVDGALHRASHAKSIS
jgi:apolipoprotein N-acyltransferase